MTDIKNEMDSDLDQNYSLNSNADPKNMQELTIYIITRIDDMGNRIDDLEKSIADLMNQAGVEGPEK
uniref:Heat shock factor-binding protein 1 n=1 Tax=Glossina pallidipes TaxID=7398 RepID=A0A1B0GGM3_GLOPL